VGGLLAVVGLEVTTEGIMTGTGTERWRERVSDFRGCDAKVRLRCYEGPYRFSIKGEVWVFDSVLYIFISD